MAGFAGLDPEFDTRLRALATAAREAGYDPRLTSGYRSPQDQARAIDSVSRNVNGRPASMVEFSRGIPGYAAPVGGSRHQDGVAADWGTGPALQWMRENAPRYGVSFPAGLAKTDPVHSELDNKFYGPVQDPRAREGVAVPLFDTGKPGNPAPIRPTPSASAPSAPSAPQQASTSTGAPAPMVMPQQEPGGLMGLLKGFQGAISSPLFQGGAGMYSAASQGKDIGTAFLANGEAASRASKNQLEQAKAEREMQSQQMQEQLFNSLGQGGNAPAWAASLPAGALDLAKALGPQAGSQLLTQLVMSQPQREESAARLKIAQNADSRAAELQPLQVAQLARKDVLPVEQEMLAAGIVRGSPEWNETIRRKLPGGSPIDQLTSNIVKNMQPTQPAPAQPIPPMLQPQSFTPQAPGQPDPNLQLTAGPQSNAPAPQPGGPPQAVQDLVETPYGKMTQDQARQMAGVLALDKRDAASKLIMDSLDKQQLGKEAANENDKKELAAIDGLQRARRIAAGFKPEWQTFEGMAKQYGVSWLDSFDSIRGKLPKETTADFVSYTLYKRDASANLTQGIKDATGAAMGVEEAKRITKGLPDPDKDSPAQFAAKLAGTIRDYEATIARTRYLRLNGFKGQPWDPGSKPGDKAERDLPISQFFRMIDQDGDNIAKQIKAKNPQASDTDVQQAVKQQLRAKYGVDA